MSKLTKIAFRLLDLIVIFTMTFSMPAGVLAAPSPTGATITSDAADYPPGATVTLTGAGWMAGEAVHIFVNDDAGQSWSNHSDPDPVADANGTFTYQFQLPNWFVANYSVTAGPGSLGSGTATATFTDLSIGTYDQCSNDTGTGYTAGDTGCRWINGNLQSNNSIYYEGDATVQRVWLTGFVPGSTHSITLKYGTTKGGKHAYDFLTRWDWSEDWISVADRCQDIVGCETATDQALAIPVDPNANGFDAAANLIKPRQFVMRGGTLTSATNPTIVSGDYSGDSETVITVNFTVASSGAMCPTTGSDKGTCGVALWFGAHVAAQANWGLGLGAGSISGSPYHVALNAIDGASVGQRDNQMQANVVTFIPNGTIIIIKDAQPDDAQDFSFNLQNNPVTINSNFDLDDDGDATLSNTKTFSVPPGTWLASELNIPTGWTLADLQCSIAGTNGSSATTDKATAKATITLKSNDTVTCTFADSKERVADLVVTKTAVPSFSRLYGWSIDKSVDQTTINIADGSKAIFNYSVKVTPDGDTDSNWKVAGQITVANSNNLAISGVNVSDTIDNGGVCSVPNGTNLTVPANDKVVLNYSCTYAVEPSSVTGTNTATATWTASDYYGTSGSASGTAGVDFSNVTPAETNKIITVVDDKTDPANPVTLGTWNWNDGAHTFTYSLEKLGIGGTCKEYTNTAEIVETDQSDSQTVKVCVGKDLTVTKTAAGSYDRAYQWELSKAVDQTLVKIAEGGSYTFQYTVVAKQTGITDDNWTVAGKITISNPNDWENITLTSLSDGVDNGGSCSFAAGPHTILAGKTLDIAYTCLYASAPSSYSGTNTATITWDKAAYFTPNDSASGSASFTLTQLGSTNKTIHVTDSFGGSLGTVTATDVAPFAKATFTYTRTEKGVAGTCTKYDNTATITETGQSAEQSVTLCVGKDLTVTKTAAGTFNRSYLWKITKDVDKTLVKIAEGGSYTFNYTVVAEQTGMTDAGWSLAGKITLTNPNDWEDITLTSLSDVVDNGGTCTVDPGPYTVAKSGSLDVNYTCSYASAPSSYSGKNTVTATWDKALAFTPTDLASGSADFTLTQLGSTNKTIHVTDSYANALGTVTANDTTPFAKGTFTYQRTESGVAGTCTKYDNTATITETGQKADKTVTLCVGKDLTLSKTAAGTFDRTYLWKISKDVDKTSVNIANGGMATFNYTVIAEQTGITDSGWTLAGVITLANPNDWEDITLTSLLDVVDNGGTCTVAAGPYTVLAGKTLDVAYTCSYSAVSSLSGRNTATAAWDKAQYFTPNASASAEKAFSLAQLGSTNKTIHVTDTLGGNHGTATATDLAPFAKATFTYSYDFAGVGGTCKNYNNTAKITETSQSASQSVKVCVGLDLTVAKTAAGTFDRAYHWLIDKSVDHTLIEIAKGGTATFNYTVKVTPNGYIDSGWTLGGTITITNPNDWEAITADVTDVYNGGGVCSVTGGNDVVIPAGKSVILNYSCLFASQPVYTGMNSATAVWDAAAFFTPTGSASGNAAVTLTLKGETNRTITVIDDKTDPSNPVTLGTSDYYAGPFEFKYSLNKQGAAGTCTNYTNTALIQETGQSDTQKVTVCVGLDLTVSKTATASKDRTYHWLIDKSVDDTRIEIASGSTATFNYNVKVTPNGFTDSDFTLAGTITIVNPNDWEDITVNVADVLDQGGTCSITEAAPYVVLKSTSLTLHYTCTTDGSATKNTATVTWDKAKYFTPTGSASKDAAVSFALDVETNKTITVVDDKTDPLNPVTLGTSNFYSGPFEFKYALEKAGVPGTCTNYTNTAVIDETKQSDSQMVTVCVGVDLTIAKTAAGTFDRTYLWKISKDVDKTSVNMANGSTATFNYTVIAEQTGFTDSGWTLSGKITLTNPNDWEDITLTGLSDVVNNGGTCTVDPGPYVVLKSGTLSVNYSCTYASAPSSYSGKNTATATWDKAKYFTPNASASAEKAFTLKQKGATNQTIHVTDTLGGNLGTVTATDVAPFAKATFQYSKGFTGVGGKCTDYNNTATITETGQSASQSVKVCVGLDLTVAKTAAGTFDRTYHWLISKNVDKTSVKVVYGSAAIFNYTVKVTPNGYTDSGWTLSGKITLTNPNDWEDITLTSLSDVVDNGGICTVAAGPYVVPKNGTLAVNYNCSYSSASALSGTNTAAAVWDKAKYFTPTGSATGTAPFTLAQLGSTNKTITVVDDKTDPLHPVTLGTSNYYSGPYEFKYALSKMGVAGTCINYTNIALIKETGQKASQTITVCVGLNLGARTMGFWQNKNGQNIILQAGAISGTMTCKATPWLRQFAPFQDLSATAPCKAVAVYVYNVIKSASASGASMNAMLKGQMLATALDVYFSDPALGGNKIGAPVPIGGVTIDLTYIKANGGYQNVSSAFGGATSMTVMDMLTYAAGKSNVGGTLWYNNVKSIQGLAKNAFDAINNNWVFPP